MRRVAVEVGLLDATILRKSARGEFWASPQRLSAPGPIKKRTPGFPRMGVCMEEKGPCGFSQGLNWEVTTVAQDKGHVTGGGKPYTANDVQTMLR